MSQNIIIPVCTIFMGQLNIYFKKTGGKLEKELTTTGTEAGKADSLMGKELSINRELKGHS